MGKNKIVGGVLAAAVPAVFLLITVGVVLSGGWIMFNQNRMTFLILTLVLPSAVQLAVYIAWYIKKDKNESRNSNELAREGLIICAVSVLLTSFILIGMALVFSLWEEGWLFLFIAVVLYFVSNPVQYIFFRPY